MQINITGHHVELTDGLNQAVTQKCNKIASHFPDLSMINVVLTVDNNVQTAEATTHYLGQDIVAKASSDELYKALPEMAAKLQSSLSKRKEIAKSHAHTKPEVDIDLDGEDEASLAT